MWAITQIPGTSCDEEQVTRKETESAKPGFPCLTHGCRWPCQGLRFPTHHSQAPFLGSEFSTYSSAEPQSSLWFLSAETSPSLTDLTRHLTFRE